MRNDKSLIKVARFVDNPQLALWPIDMTSAAPTRKPDFRATRSMRTGRLPGEDGLINRTARILTEGILAKSITGQRC